MAVEVLLIPLSDDEVLANFVVVPNTLTGGSLSTTLGQMIHKALTPPFGPLSPGLLLGLQQCTGASEAKITQGMNHLRWIISQLNVSKGKKLRNGKIPDLVNLSLLFTVEIKSHTVASRHLSSIAQVAHTPLSNQLISYMSETDTDRCLLLDIGPRNGHFNYQFFLASMVELQQEVPRSKGKTYCPFCGESYVDINGHHKRDKHKNNVIRALYRE